MKKLTLLIVSLAFALQGFAIIISGNVVDQETGIGLDGLHLDLYTQSGLVQFTTSQADGYFEFPNALEGWNVLDYHGYEPAIINGVYYLKTTYPDTIVVDSSDITGIVFEIAPHYAHYHVSGTLYDATTGHTIQNQAISLRLDMAGYGEFFFAWADSSGNYSFTDSLPDWDYEFHAFANAYFYGKDTTLTIEKDGPTDLTMDFYLIPKTGISVSGELRAVETNEPIPIANRTIILLAIDPYWAETDENGNFTFVNVTPGYYSMIGVRSEDTSYVNTEGSEIYDITIPEEGLDNVVLYQKRWQTLHVITIDHTTFTVGETNNYRFKLVLDDYSYGSIWGVVLNLSEGVTANNVTDFKRYETNNVIFDQNASCTYPDRLVWSGYHYIPFGGTYGNLDVLNDSVYVDLDLSFDARDTMENATVSYEINYSYPCMIQPFSFGAIELSNADASAGISEHANPEIALDCYPNPVNDLAKFELTILKTTQGRLVLFDMTGKELNVIREGLLKEGVHKIIYPTLGLKNGIYFFRWISDTENSCGKMVICH